MDLLISVHYAIGQVIAELALELRRSPDNRFLGLSAYIITFFVQYCYQITELEVLKKEEKEHSTLACV